MKKGFYLLASSLLLLSACNQTKDSSTTDHTAMAKRNSESFAAINRAIENGDVSHLDSLMSKNVVDHEGNMGKDIVGLDSVKSYLAVMHTYVDNLKWEVVSDGTSPDGKYYFALVNMTGKAKANPWQMPVGKVINFTSVDVLKMADGKFTDHWSFTSQKDINEMMMQMQQSMKPGPDPSGGK